MIAGLAKAPCTSTGPDHAGDQQDRRAGQRDDVGADLVEDERRDDRGEHERA